MRPRQFLKWLTIAAFATFYLISVYNYEMYRRESVNGLRQQLANYVTHERIQELSALRQRTYDQRNRLKQLEARIMAADFSELEILTGKVNLDR